MVDPCTAITFMNSKEAFGYFSNCKKNFLNRNIFSVPKRDTHEHRRSSSVWCLSLSICITNSHESETRCGKLPFPHLNATLQLELDAAPVVLNVSRQFRRLNAVSCLPWFAYALSIGLHVAEIFTSISHDLQDESVWSKNGKSSAQLSLAAH